MRHQVAGRRFSRSTGLRQKLFRSLITALLSHGRITTTEAKAKSIRGDVERLITVAKNSNRGNVVAWVHARRQVDRVVCDKAASLKLFDELAPKLRERKGGYTRLYKVGPRQGDGAPMVVLELVEQ
jgi:large subunit ribosomal protein L17